MTVQHYIRSKPESQQEIMIILRSWILDLGSHVQEKISAEVPHFDFYGDLCAISAKEGGVDLNFSKGYELTDEHKLLESKGRKQVRSITFHSVAEIEENEDRVRQLLNEAAILNEYRYKRQKKSSK